MTNGAGDDAPVSQYMSNVRYQRLMEMREPIPMTGRVEVTSDRRVLWKNVCMIGEDCRECIIEMSRNKLKFFIIGLELATGQWHLIEMWRAQANNVIKGCDNNLQKLMTFLEFRYGKLQIKDYELLLQHQLYQPKKREPDFVSIRHNELPGVNRSVSYERGDALVKIRNSVDGSPRENGKKYKPNMTNFKKRQVSKPLRLSVQPMGTERR